MALVHVAQISPCQSVITTRFPSVNIDIIVFLLLHSARFIHIRCPVDNGTGKNRKIIDMITTGLSVLECQVLAGTHAFSGNDYISCFFRKRKKFFFGKTLEAINNFLKLSQIFEEEFDLITLAYDQWIMFVKKPLSVNLNRKGKP